MTFRHPIASANRFCRPAALGTASFLAALVLFLALAQTATAYVYWTNRSGGAGTTIGRANLDGTGADQTFIGGASGPVGVAVDAAHIYWANAFGAHSTIGRANLNGTEATQSFITGAADPCGVALNSEYIYWGNHESGTIGRAKLDGEDPEENFISGANHPCGVAVDGSYVYWANERGTTIGRAKLDGEEPDETFIGGAQEPAGVTVNGSFVYWGNNQSNTIGRALLNGNEANNSFITGSGGCTNSPAVDGTYIYWANDCAASIGRANLDGTGVEENFIGVPANPGGVAVDSLSPGMTPPNGSTVPPPNNTKAPLPTNTTITNAMINKKKGKATFGFTATSATSFQCELIKPKKGKHHKGPIAAFSPCSSLQTYKHLKHGRYTFEVRGVSSTGADSMPAVKKFKI